MTLTTWFYLWWLSKDILGCITWHCGKIWFLWMDCFHRGLLVKGFEFVVAEISLKLKGFIFLILPYRFGRGIGFLFILEAWDGFLGVTLVVSHFRVDLRVMENPSTLQNFQCSQPRLWSNVTHPLQYMFAFIWDIVPQWFRKIDVALFVLFQDDLIIWCFEGRITHYETIHYDS